MDQLQVGPHPTIDLTPTCYDTAVNDDTNVLVMSRSLRNWHRGESSNPASLYQRWIALKSACRATSVLSRVLSVNSSLKTQDHNIEWCSTVVNSVDPNKSFQWDWGHPTQDIPSAYFFILNSRHGRDKPYYYCVERHSCIVWESSNLDTWSNPNRPGQFPH